MEDLMDILLNLVVFQAILLVAFIHFVEKRILKRDLLISVLMLFGVCLLFRQSVPEVLKGGQTQLILTFLECSVLSLIPLIFLNFILSVGFQTSQSNRGTLYFLALVPIMVFTGHLFLKGMSIVEDIEEIIRILYSVQASIVIIYAIIPHLSFKQQEIGDNKHYQAVVQISFLFGSFGILLLSHSLFYQTLQKHQFFLSLFKIVITIPLLLMVFLNYKNKFRQKLGTVDNPNGTEPNKTVKYANSSMTSSVLLEMGAKLSQIMEIEKPFLKNELQLKDLASLLDMSVHHTSQLINEIHGENYYSFINRYRVVHAIRLMKSIKKGELNVTDIAYESGFNNKVSFYKSFRKITGLTPTEYMSMSAV